MSAAGVGVAGPVVPLTRWGVSPDADLVYRTLLRFGPRTVNQLARELGLPPQRVQDAVDELSTGGAVFAAPHGGGCRDCRRWTAECPQTAVARLRRRTNATARDARQPARLSDREASVVRLLAAGYSDARTAAELGISLRTIGYTVRTLMDRYGVRSRFQLGLVLGAIFDR